MFYKLIDLDFNIFFTINNNSNTLNLRRHKFQIYKPRHPNSLIRGQFFSYRIISTWNQLPEDLISTSSLLLFKIKLDKFNLDNLIRYKI